MRNSLLAATVAALFLTGGCRKTGEGEYEVQKPVVGTQKDTIIVDKPVVGTVPDTVKTPTVDVTTEKDTITTPTVTTKKTEIEVPKVKVNPPQ